MEGLIAAPGEVNTVKVSPYLTCEGSPIWALTG